MAVTWWIVGFFLPRCQLVFGQNNHVLIVRCHSLSKSNMKIALGSYMDFVLVFAEKTTETFILLEFQEIFDEFT